MIGWIGESWAWPREGWGEGTMQERRDVGGKEGPPQPPSGPGTLRLTEEAACLAS